MLLTRALRVCGLGKVDPALGRAQRSVCDGHHGNRYQNPRPVTRVHRWAVGRLRGVRHALTLEGPDLGGYR
jgi:hypothetical protein